MKSHFGLVFFDIALLICLSSTSVLAEALLDSDCIAPLNIPKSLVHHCPKLLREKSSATSLTNAVAHVTLKILSECETNVEYLCNSLPEIFAKYAGGGRDKCQDHLKTFLCRNVNNDLRAIHCSYKSAVTELINKLDRWTHGEESQVCSYFEANHSICGIAKKIVCDRISNVLTKAYCNRMITKNHC